MREGEAPSYFNPIEASSLADLVQSLLEQHQVSSGRPGVAVEDIGVIATYRKQVVHRIMHSCIKKGLAVGSSACSLTELVAVKAHFRPSPLWNWTRGQPLLFLGHSHLCASW